jgi:hypothetical protein
MHIRNLILAAAATVLALAAPGWGAGGAHGSGGEQAAGRASAGDCTRPLTYDVVAIDPRHHISRQAFVALLRRSERLWEAPSGLDLVRYVPGGTVKVELVYDDRQVKHDEVAAAAASVGRARSALATQKAALKPAAAEIARRRARFQQRVAYWNGRGGAPKDVHSALEQERAALNALVDTFNARTTAFNRSIAQLNLQVVAYNALIHSRTTTDEVLGKAALGGTAVEIAVLSGSGRDDVLIAHEFGHIFGIRHLPGAANIMNPQVVGVLTGASPADLAALRVACAAGG